MPGIAGILRTNWTGEDDATLGTLARNLSCEPNDKKGLARPTSGLGISWVQHADSASNTWPVWNEREDVGLVLCGECFITPETRPAPATSGTNEAVTARQLVHLYEQNGLAFLAALDGAFCGLVIDRRNQRVVLFNDRYGLRRTYHYRTGDAFYFATEAKSLLRARPALRQIDPRGFGELFSCGAVLQNRALFPQLAILPGAACWTFSPDGSCHQASYFTPATWENQPALELAEYTERLTDIFRRITPSYVDSPMGTGLSLTGGIDSRLILAAANAQTKKLPCYTFGGPYRDCRDVLLARELAQSSGLSYQTIPIQDDFFLQFPTLAEQTVRISDGTMDVSGAVELYANRRAREIAPVRLTGSYGSEILRSMVAFRPGKFDESIFDAEFAKSLRRAEATYAEEIRGPVLSFIAFKQVPWFHYARFAIEDSQLTVRSPFLDHQLVKLAYQAPPAHVSDPAPLLEVISRLDPKLARFGTDRSHRRHAIPGVSLLARAYQEFTVKAEYAYDYGMPQRLATFDHWVAPLHLERLFLGRHKFYHFRIWYRDRLADYVKATLLDPRTLSRPFLDRRRVEHVVTSHVKGTANHTLAIHKLLTAELIHRLFID